MKPVQFSGSFYGIPASMLTAWDIKMMSKPYFSAPEPEDRVYVTTSYFKDSEEENGWCNATVEGYDPAKVAEVDLLILEKLKHVPAFIADHYETAVNHQKAHLVDKYGYPLYEYRDELCYRSSTTHEPEKPTPLIPEKREPRYEEMTPSYLQQRLNRLLKRWKPNQKDFKQAFGFEFKHIWDDASGPMRDVLRQTIRQYFPRQADAIVKDTFLDPRFLRTVGQK